MTGTTEVELFDQLTSNLKAAISECETLAALHPVLRGEAPQPFRGPAYIRLRENFKLMEGSCRQIAQWREDTRWLPLGLYFEECHQKAMKWVAQKAPPHMFKFLVVQLAGAFVMVERLRTAKTDKLPEGYARQGVLGTILPTPLEGPHRDTTPVQVKLPVHDAND